MRISDWSSDVCSSDLLLEHLRRLRQRIEFAGVDAARHQIVARALGRRRGQDRRLIFGEALLGHAAAQAGDAVRARSEERRVGKEGVSTCRSRGSPDNEKKKNTSMKEKTAILEK